jgi:iron(II)-dependent oxidoreductase
MVFSVYGSGMNGESRLPHTDQPSGFLLISGSAFMAIIALVSVWFVPRRYCASAQWRKAVRRVLLAFIITLRLAAQSPAIQIEGVQILGPSAPEDFPKWIADMKRWRMEYLKRIGYDGSEYARPELKWTQSSYVQPQMMIEDHYFYDPVARKYTVERYLDDLEKRYGGIDSVLVWHTYPNIGIDNRSQFDHFRDMPGGIPALKQMVADFHRRGVRVLFPIMLWDQGTKDPGSPEYDLLARNLAEIGADGVNGDTMQAVPRAFRKASDNTGHPLAFQAEHLTVDEALAYNNLAWGQATVPPTSTLPRPVAPMVNKYKWLEPRHMTDISDRWEREKIVDLQYAFFNGIGMESWENIWGIWNGMTPRDSEATRHIARIERQFSDLLVSPDWEPHTPMLQNSVYASKWPGQNAILWMILNKNEYDVSGPQLRVPQRGSMRYFDLWHGNEVKPESDGEYSVLSLDIEANGFGAVLATTVPGSRLPAFLADMAKLSSRRLDSFSRERGFLSQHLTGIASTKHASQAPANMVLIPTGDFEFKVSGIEIEGSNEIGVDVQYPWENSPRRHHRHVLPIKSFYMDRTPVTNTEFKRFLDATHYRPADDHNFLRDWTNGTYPQGWANKPVTWISLEDARVYAFWAGKRLPHEWEWQYAAMGRDGRTYPWGNTWSAEAVPVPDKGRDLRGPDEVEAHSNGASPFGVLDLVGNVWQWTDEYTDEHTRASILKGGSYYQPQGSHWYFPQAYKLTEHGKLLLMAPSKDRAGTVGFRCVVDVE